MKNVGKTLIGSGEKEELKQMKSYSLKLVFFFGDFRLKRLKQNWMNFRCGRKNTEMLQKVRKGKLQINSKLASEKGQTPPVSV